MTALLLLYGPVRKRLLTIVCVHKKSMKKEPYFSISVSLMLIWNYFKEMLQKSSSLFSIISC